MRKPARQAVPLASLTLNLFRGPVRGAASQLARTGPRSGFFFPAVSIPLHYSHYCMRPATNPTRGSCVSGTKSRIADRLAVSPGPTQTR